eukprot:TRINITY_DN8319_c0_g4_i3.p1 TRINITY_DN8319_c0_g4~~TRINITY_DN8319_c0_g4_i3.p1  ORF type:complete len:1297 (+),score=261.91 TRINITY_DN8319_c0_g4_i3:83-3892(+)
MTDPKKGVSVTGSSSYDDELYGGGSKKEDHLRNVALEDDDSDEEDELQKKLNKELLNETNHDEDVFAKTKQKTIADRESDYQKKNRLLAAERFAKGSSYEQRMAESQKEQELDDELSRLRKLERDSNNKSKQKDAPPATIEQKTKRSRWDTTADGEKTEPVSEWDTAPEDTTPHRRNRWDTPTPGRKSKAGDDDGFGSIATPVVPSGKTSRWDAPATPRAPTGEETPNRWGDISTPAAGNQWDATPARKDSSDDKVWDATPQRKPSNLKWDSASSAIPATPARSKWDDTPLQATPQQEAATFGQTPSAAMGQTPVGNFGQTPVGNFAQTPVGGFPGVAPDSYNQMRYADEINKRNLPLSDEDLNEVLPSEGYKILVPPESYKPITPARKYTSAPTPFGSGSGFSIPEVQPTSSTGSRIDIRDLGPDLPSLKPDDYNHFAALLHSKPESEMTKEEAKEIWVMKLLLKVKNGTPQQRKSAQKTLTQRARWFGAGLLFEQILPLLMSPTLEDQERHVLVKLIGRLLFKLEDLVKPYVHKILVVIEPMLIDEDSYARIEGREIISNLSKAAGMGTMIQTMNPDIDSVDEHVRNTTSRAFAVVTSALGIVTLLPFLRAVCKAKKSWQARHTGVKIIQQIAILMGAAILPHLKSLVDCIAERLSDEQPKIRTMTSLSLAALAEAAHPYGIEAFDSVLRPLWTGTQELRGKPLAASLKAIGYIIPLMDEKSAPAYTKAVVDILINEMKSPDEDMKKIVLKVTKQCVETKGVERAYVRASISPHFFRNFWVKRMALDRRNYLSLIETTNAIANKVGATEVIERIVDDLQDENEAYRKMVMATVHKVVESMGTSDISQKTEEKLLDGAIYAFQEQSSEETDDVVLLGFAAILNALGSRAKAYIPQIAGNIKWRLTYKEPAVRQQAADLVSKICRVIKTCEEDATLGHLGVVLYEYLGEEFPEVLGSILAGIKGIVNVIGMNRMTPPIKDLLPKLTPILDNRHEKVQENCIDLVGRIADRASEAVPAREWARISQKLIDLLKAHKKAIRRAAVNTFGYIAKAIGPLDVMTTLLNNLKVLERQQRVCTTVAIAIVAETCNPFTVIPGLMNEYRVPEKNVQNGVLKAFSFLFEYIGELGKDYCNAVIPLLEDALMDRDVIHRQIACNVVRHMALGVVGLDCEPAMLHLLNFVWPNIFETLPHTVNSCVEAIEACRVCLGPSVILMYVLQGLFHPARNVREIYWKIYNNIYIGCQDALVPALPRLEDDSSNHYTITELDTFI